MVSLILIKYITEMDNGGETVYLGPKVVSEICVGMIFVDLLLFN